MRRFLLIVAIAGLTACQSVPGTVHIDYIDFVRVAGISYSAAWTSPGRPLQEGDLGAVYAKVKVKLEGSQDVHHQLQDGDSAFLDPGTPLLQIKGYRPTFRLAAHARGRITLYEVDTSPTSRVGADLLDLEGKVQYIGIASSLGPDRTETGTIRDAASVEALVNMVLKAPVDHSPRSGHSGLQYFIDFHLRDGTETSRSYWRQGRDLSDGIMLPAAFDAAVAAAVGASPAQSPAVRPQDLGRAQIGVPYAFRLYTHCGPDWRTSFDGSYWDLASPVQTAFDDPFQDGTMTLKTVDQAQFEYQRNAGQGSIGFRRHIDGAPLKSPAGCD